MGVKLRERPGKGWYVLTDWKGQRKAKCFGKNKALAKEFKEKLEAKLKLGAIGVSSKSEIKLSDYATTWLDRICHTRKRSTHCDYKAVLDGHITPKLGGLYLEDVTRDKVRSLAYDCIKLKLSYKTVFKIIRTLSSLLSHAVEDGLLVVNPALRPGKFLPKQSKRSSINPFTREEVGVFLSAVQKHAPQHYPLFLCAVRTGLRLGELLALQWGDIDFHGSFIEVQRNYTRGEITTPKSGEGRRVDMSNGLSQALQDLKTLRQFEAAVNGWPEVPAWIFCNETGGLFDPDNLRKRVFHPVLKKSELRQIRFHDLRHTFASILLQQGESPVYVKEQMGHSSIQVTVDVYGHLIPGGNKQAVDRLDEDPKTTESATQTQPKEKGADQAA